MKRHDDKLHKSESRKYTTQQFTCAECHGWKELLVNKQVLQPKA